MEYNIAIKPTVWAEKVRIGRLFFVNTNPYLKSGGLYYA